MTKINNKEDLRVHMDRGEAFSSGLGKIGGTIEMVADQHLTK